MKTFTTYAEKKAKQILNLLQGYTKGIRFTAILILLLMGVSNAWAYNVKSPHVYFNATNVSSWPGVNIVVGHDSYSFGDLMSKVSNTNLYYAKVTFNGTDANGFVFIGANSKWGEWNGQSLYNRTQSQSNRTDYLWFYNTITGGLPSGTYYFSTSGNKQAIDYSQYKTIPTFNTTSAVRVRTGTSGTYSDASGTYPADISIQGTYISGNGKTDRTSITSTKSSDGDDKKVYGSVITGLVTLSYSDLNEAYTFDGWGTSNSKVSSTSTNYEFNQSANTTVYAFFTKKTYTITYKQGANGSGSIDAGTKEHGVDYTLSSNKFTRTGYTQTGWSTSDGGAKVYDLGGTYTANTNVTLYPFWTPNQYTITLNANGGASNGSATATYNSSTITNLTHPTRTDYRCNGYYTATSGGTLVLNTDGTLAKSVSGYTDANGNWTKDGIATLYAQWTYDVTEYTVTFGVGTGSTSYGSLSAKNNSTSASITSPATVRSGQSITFTATPKTGYEVEGWYTNAACTAGKHDAGSTTYTTSITGGTYVYVKFVEKKWSVAFAAGTGGSVTTPSSTPQTVGQITGISIAATPTTGYTFKQWTITSGSGSFTSAATTNSNKFKPTANSTVTASFTENLYAITVQSSDDNHGTVTKSADKAGIATFITITAKPKEGYRFVNWTTATAGITIANPTDASTTVTATAAGTITANFEEIPKETIYFVNKDNWSKVNVHLWGGDEDDTTWPGIEATKADFQLHCCDVYYVSALPGSYKNCIFNNGSGSQTADLTWTAGKYFYNGAWKTLDELTYEVQLAGSMLVNNGDWVLQDMTVDANNTNSITVSLNANTTYKFKIVVDNNWHGNNGTMTNGNSTDWTMSISEGDCQITTTIAGDYTFTYDVCTAKLSVTYPKAYTVTYSRTPTAAADAPTTSPSITSGNYVAAGTRVTFTAKTAKTGYTFKGWYDNNKGTGDALSTNLAYTCTINANTTIYAVYTVNTYNINIVANPTEAAESLTTSPQAVGAEKVNISTTAKFTYKFDKWTATDGITITDASNPSTSITATKAGTVTANFTQLQPTTVYLKPNENWKTADARFAIYYWHAGQPDGWVDMTDVGCNKDYFVADIPAGYVDFKFVRLDPSGKGDASKNDGWDWSYKWNETGDLAVPTDGKNLFTLATADWDGSTTTWGIYTPPTYTININAPESGSIAVTVGSSTTTVTNTPKQITNIAAGTTFTVAYTPNEGFALGHSEVEGIKETYAGADTYTVCGPVAITAHFITSKEQVVYLRPNDNWLADNALFYACASKRYGGDNEWIELVTEGTDYTGAYGCTIPAGYSHVNFVRLNPNGTDNSNNKLNLNNAWNQTIDYVIPINPTNNRFIIGEKVISGGDKDKYKGSWEASNTPIWSIPGDWQGAETWAAENATPLYGPNGNATLALQASITKEFKLYQFPYGTQAEQWYGHAETLVRGNSADKEFTTGGTANCQLKTDIAGDYVFAFNIRDKKLTVAYPEIIPAPTTSIESEQRVFEDEVLADGWVAGDGTEANPYQLYADEAVRITVSPLPEVEGLTAYYTFGNTAEQPSNIFDWKGIYSTATNLTVTAYYKNAMGTKIAEATATTHYFKTLPLPFNLMTQPKDEINIDQVAAGKNITVQFRSDSRATVDLYIGDTNGTPITTFSNTISKDYEYDVPNDIQPSILTFIAKANTPVHGRTFEKSVDVVIYKNVIIKVNDPEGWVKNVYTWRDYSDAVLTPWPGDPVLQNYGTWRVFSVKYPYYDRFIINDGNSGGSKQTLDWELPADDTCYELLDPANNGSNKAEDKDKYGLKIAKCPGDLLVSDIKDTTIMEGEQIVVMPEIFVGIGYKLSDIEADITNDNTRSVRAMMSGTNITVLGTSAGVAKITVTYTLNNERIDKTFKVNVEKKNTIKIQVKVPIASGGTYDNIGWSDNSLIKIHYWFTGKQGDIPLRYVYEEADKYKYMQAEVPLDANGYTNFLIGYNDIDENWEKTADIKNVNKDGCYTLKNGGWGNSPTATREDGDVFCWDENDYADYQVKVLMQNGKTYLSNITYSKEAILSFFAPGKDATGRNAGAVMLYRNGKLASSIDPATFDESNVYVATVNETGNGLTNIAPYTGNYYIRTWDSSYATKGFIDGHGWNSIKDLTANEKDSLKFTYFISRENEFYNHYWVQAMHTIGFTGKDVSACVANEYNDDLAGKLTQGKGTNENGNIEVKTEDKKQNDFVINVRFGYDPRTNYFGRAIIKGSEYNDYLNIHCDNAYKDKNCSTKLPYGTSSLENKMQDISNWVYQRDFYVPITNSYPSASLYVEATSPSIEMTVTDHLLGYVTNEVTGEESNTPVQRTVIGSGTTNGTYLIRVVYDFKTNRIIAAWVPQGTIEVTDDRTLNADVLFVRKENEEVPQIQLANDGKIRSLESMYFALELERGDKNAARHEEQYFFTLPFNSIVGSISGVPGYMQTWGIQRYRGDLRAQKGWFIETPTFWEWLDLDDVMHAGEGYLLVFDKKAAPWEEIEVDKYDAEGHIMQDANGNNIKEKISMMRLYFPSTTVGFDMQQQSEEHLTRTYENHTCTITREDRDKQDSNWKVIGTTSYNNAGIASYTKDTDPEYTEMEGGEAPKFRYTYTYEFDENNNRTKYTYTPEDGESATYKSFFGYMVQFAGTISWQPIMSETVPEGIAARRRVVEGERTSYTTRLELANANGEKQDQAFVALDEKATTTFDQNKDLNKIINAGTNIYTLSEGIPFAGNTLPMAKTTVPVGVVITETGEYTFRMPDGTDGISAILVDNQTGAHTNMLYDEYTVTLDAGTIENRFYLILDPKRTATSLEDVLGDGNEANGDEAKGVEKFIIDGQLIIRTADGIYDAQGQRL